MRSAILSIGDRRVHGTCQFRFLATAEGVELRVTAPSGHTDATLFDAEGAEEIADMLARMAKVSRVLKAQSVSFVPPTAGRE